MKNKLHSLRPVLLVAILALLPAAAQAQAIQAWVQRYNGPGNSSDSATALAVDGSDNIIVTGTSYSSASQDDCATIKYSNAGVPLWTNRYNGPANSDDRASKVAVGDNGNVYVTGFTVGNTSAEDYLTIAYSSAGLTLWTKRYNGTGNGGDRASALAVDSNNNVIVTGNSDGHTDPSLVSFDYTTIKYSSAGVPLWTNLYNGPGNGWDQANAVAVDESDNVIVTGTSVGNGSFDDYTTIKYSSSGVPLWTNRYNGPGNGGDAPWAMAVDGSNNVIVTGASLGIGGNTDYLTIKYSSDGLPLWTNRYNGPANNDDYAWAVAVDGSNNVIVTGYSSTGANYDYLTIKYSNAGVPLWTNRYNRVGAVGFFFVGIAVDGRNNVIVAGYSYGGGSNPDYLTIAYSGAGVPLWTNRYNGPGNGQDQANAVTVDSRGDVFVTGASTGSNGYYDFATIKYSNVPIIISQPLSRTNAVGTTVSFGLAGAGGLPLSYQWRRDGTNLVDGGTISGVTTTNLLIANVQPTDAAGYRVVITNAYGSMTSTVAQLTVTIPPSPGRFTNFSYSPATGFSFIFRDGTLGQHYRIQRSSSLAEGSWSVWQSFTYTEPTGFMDAGAIGIERRYYRAVSP